MGLTVSASNSNYVPPPAGSHIAVCTQVIDLGRQHSDFYNKDDEKVMIGWELCNVLDPDRANNPKMVFARYTSSLGKKATLRKMLQAWRGRPFTEDELAGFELKKLLGAGCLIQVVHNQNDGNTYANVEAVMSIPQGTPKPKAHGALVAFEIDNWDAEAFSGFSEGLQAKIMDGKKRRAEFEAAKNTNTTPQYDAVPTSDDDIPF